MPSTMRPVANGAWIAVNHCLLIDDDHEFDADISAALPAARYRLRRIAPDARPAEIFEGDRPQALIVSERTLTGRSTGPSALIAEALAAGIPTLAVVDDVLDADALAERLVGVADWVTRRGLEQELCARLTCLIARPALTKDQGCTSRPAPSRGSAPPTDGQFFALVIHDLRTPLNVIGLSLRMISQAVPKGDSELEEDLRFVEENFRQIERMLSQLGDYYRLFESAGPLGPTEFNPRRLVDELLEARTIKPGGRAGAVQLQIEPSCPEEVALDPARARLALHYALVNATAAAQGGPIVMTMYGGPQRWVIEFTLDSPPPNSVHSTILHPTVFERLCGSAAERRGMDLAIAAKVSESFGGTGRLIVKPGRGTTLVFDWPVRLGAS